MRAQSIWRPNTGDKHQVFPAIKADEKGINALGAWGNVAMKKPEILFIDEALGRSMLPSRDAGA
jgi:hypothetical protein